MVKQHFTTLASQALQAATLCPYPRMPQPQVALGLGEFGVSLPGIQKSHDWTTEHGGHDHHISNNLPTAACQVQAIEGLATHQSPWRSAGGWIELGVVDHMPQGIHHDQHSGTNDPSRPTEISLVQLIRDIAGENRQQQSELQLMTQEDHVVTKSHSQNDTQHGGQTSEPHHHGRTHTDCQGRSQPFGQAGWRFRHHTGWLQQGLLTALAALTLTVRHGHHKWNQRQVWDSLEHEMLF